METSTCSFHLGDPVQVTTQDSKEEVVQLHTSDASRLASSPSSSFPSSPPSPPRPPQPRFTPDQSTLEKRGLSTQQGPISPFQPPPQQEGGVTPQRLGLSPASNKAAEVHIETPSHGKLDQTFPGKAGALVVKATSPEKVMHQNLYVCTCACVCVCLCLLWACLIRRSLDWRQLVWSERSGQRR